MLSLAKRRVIEGIPIKLKKEETFFNFLLTFYQNKNYLSRNRVGDLKLNVLHSIFSRGLHLFGVALLVIIY